MRASKMSDWIEDLFDRAEDAGKPNDRMKGRLLYLLKLCRYEDNVEEDYEIEILSSDFDMVRYEELTTTFELNKLDVNYDYAPSQKALAKWIKRVANLE
jgi:hypothetical protein